MRGDWYRHLYLGLLCTIDLANDPLAVYDALLACDPPRIDFLAPHATWDNPPPRPPGAPAAYADWLIAIFDRWNRAGRPVDIRIFDSVIRTTRGQRSRTEAVGLAPSDLVVIETDGSYEQADSLKVTYDGAWAIGYDVFRHGLDDVGGHPGIQARQGGLAGLVRQVPPLPDRGQLRRRSLRSQVPLLAGPRRAGAAAGTARSANQARPSTTASGCAGARWATGGPSSLTMPIRPSCSPTIRSSLTPDGRSPVTRPDADR